LYKSKLKFLLSVRSFTSAGIFLLTELTGNIVMKNSKASETFPCHTGRDSWRIARAPWHLFPFGTLAILFSLGLAKAVAIYSCIGFEQDSSLWLRYHP
jgi:hypothetical protein